MAGSPKADDQQYRQFLDTARQIGADEERSAADELMGRLARTPPKPKDQPKRAATGRKVKDQR